MKKFVVLGFLIGLMGAKAHAVNFCRVELASTETGGGVRYYTVK